MSFDANTLCATGRVVSGATVWRVYTSDVRSDPQYTLPYLPSEAKRQIEKDVVPGYTIGVLELRWGYAEFIISGITPPNSGMLIYIGESALGPWFLKGNGTLYDFGNHTSPFTFYVRIVNPASYSQNLVITSIDFVEKTNCTVVWLDDMTGIVAPGDEKIGRVQITFGEGTAAFGIKVSSPEVWYNNTQISTRISNALPNLSVYYSAVERSNGESIAVGSKVAALSTAFEVDLDLFNIGSADLSITGYSIHNLVNCAEDEVSPPAQAPPALLIPSAHDWHKFWVDALKEWYNTWQPYAPTPGATQVHNGAELEAAVAGAAPGEVIELASAGAYTLTGGMTVSQPITIVSVVAGAYINGANSITASATGTVTFKGIDFRNANAVYTLVLSGGGPKIVERCIFQAACLIGVDCTTSDTVELDSCLFTGVYTTNTIRSNNATVVVTAKNVLIYGSTGIGFYKKYGTFNCYSCAANTTGANYSGVGGDYNAGTDATAPGAHSNQSITWALWYDVNYIPQNSTAKNGGDPANSATYDYYGNTINALTPPIGVFEDPYANEPFSFDVQYQSDDPDENPFDLSFTGEWAY